MSAIEVVRGRQVLDSRGNPTVEAEVYLESGASGAPSSPSGASTGLHEAVELRDGGPDWGGKGVTHAVGYVNGEINDALEGYEAADQRDVDLAMIDLDGDRPTRAASAPTRSWPSRSPPPRPPRSSRACRSTSTSAGSTPTCCRCR